MAANNNKKLEDRWIKCLAFTYSNLEDHPFEDGKKVLFDRVAFRDQKVALSPKDIARGEAHDAFYSDREVAALQQGVTITALPPVDGEGEEVDIYELSDDEMVGWLKDDAPLPQTVVNVAGTDPELAQRLLAAENKATDNDPRPEVLAGLTSIISGGVAGDTQVPSTGGTPPAPVS